MPNLLGLLLLLHLAGALRQHHGSMPARQAGPVQHPGRRPAPQRPGGSPQAQGPSGMSQGYHGVFAPITGGTASMKNTAGLYPHQINPFSLLSGAR